MSVRRNHDSCAGDVTHTSARRAPGRDDDPPGAGSRIRLVRHRLDFTRRTTRSSRCRSTTRVRHARVPALPVHRASVHLMPGPDVRDPAPGQGADCDRLGSSPPRPCGAAGWLTRTWTPVTCPRCAKAQYGHRSCRRPCSPACARYPELGFYNCFGTVRDRAAGYAAPEEHDERPASAGRPVFFVEARVVDTTVTTSHRAPPARSSTARRSCARATGRTRRPPRRPSPGAGVPSRGPWSPRDEQGYITVVDRIPGRHQHRGASWWPPARSRDVLYTHPAVAEVARHRDPGREVDRGDHRCRRAQAGPAGDAGGLIALVKAGSRRSGCRSRCASSTN